MGMNLVEKIFARHAGKADAAPGQILTVDVDYCMANDGTMRLNSTIIEKQLQLHRVWDPKKIIIVMDHQVPADTPQAAEVHGISKAFSEKFGIGAFHDSDGICHQILLEKYILPGQLVVGADSHTLSAGAIGTSGLGMGSTDISAVMASGTTWVRVPETVLVKLQGSLHSGVTPKDIILALIKITSASGLNYKSVEFTGDALASLSTPDRFTLCNMAAEAGAKTSLIAPDEGVYAYLESLRKTRIARVEWLYADKDAEYSRTIDMDLDTLEPQVACPHSVDNVHPVSAVAGKKVDQVFLGSCTNGRYEDIEIAGRVLKGRKVHPETRFLVTPASREIYIKAMREGLIETFMNAGAVVNHPSCSTCWGAGQGVLAPGQTLLSTQSRNYKGRSGSTDAMIYLASPFTVAVSALNGVITDPRDLCP
uniref:3-isopropylmalate dehydratase large subunit n=1 Tax=Candidatus Kentrum sp. FM TaxID=2126340 RepID=A0A450SSG4_9GAMM|nr:MAG: 3-isopropylmalate/(R)-2-methylmalate dehydratase large subunit/methanogen homoaconitase large subunit [Candidatus Kentron sp. FM]VFJ56910.1 MAG: 3-isopropylmalate/(R)-2-methylmalate dehydratase large subunit/methanogen homoaconitase large subunit [Candidatus Kentron sp. FM]VFK15964.1 MAG: 3-isopropylmalate/(R)-2-methylmalate dehydratase large subunit/methanogen homoaconitase large subunit [Candidatus Kentron sp. FM]